MNPLTQIKNTQKITARETARGVSDEASWHAKYKESAYVFVGGLPYDLTEGDLLAVFAQCGEVVDVNLVRDKSTGKSKGFAFLAYEDQRSTVLAVDNLNGAKVAGRIVRVDHVADYKRIAKEDEEERQQRREENGVCYAFQRGECSRGDNCRFSHDAQRNADTGWGGKEDVVRGPGRTEGSSRPNGQQHDEQGDGGRERGGDRREKGRRNERQAEGGERERENGRERDARRERKERAEHGERESAVQRGGGLRGASMEGRADRARGEEAGGRGRDARRKEGSSERAGEERCGEREERRGEREERHGEREERRGKDELEERRGGRSEWKEEQREGRRDRSDKPKRPREEDGERKWHARGDDDGMRRPRE
ncbi:hypothetical protein CLOP_g8476 [Closterium sp. NIES-67]|nr:hypothetical protein CLOP_g8476 [Closterium sp. NIES-67]